MKINQDYCRKKGGHRSSLGGTTGVNTDMCNETKTYSVQILTKRRTFWFFTCGFSNHSLFFGYQVEPNKIGVEPAWNQRKSTLWNQRGTKENRKFVKIQQWFFENPMNLEKFIGVESKSILWNHTLSVWNQNIVVVEQEKTMSLCVCVFRVSLFYCSFI